MNPLAASHQLVEIPRFQPLTFARLMARYGRFLLMFNRHRGHWEIPGGRMDPGETARAAAAHERLEETGQSAGPLVFHGLMDCHLAPGGRRAYGALYLAELNEVRPFEPNPECEQIILWNRQDEIGPIDGIDHKLLEWVRWKP